MDDKELCLNHDELAHSLAQFIKNQENMVWENIPAGMAGEVRPDVFVLNKSFAHPNPITYEIKVSVSDFRSDVTKAKWKAYLDFSYGVIFAVPKGLITKNDVPEQCGLITYNGAGIWHNVKRPTLNPCKIDGTLLLKLLMCGEERQTHPYPIKNRDFDEHKHHETLRKKFGADIQTRLYFLEEYPEKKAELDKLIKELSELTGVESNPLEFC